MLFGKSAFSQTTFFISPLINYKVQLSSYSVHQYFGTYYSEYTYLGHQNPYYTFKAKKISGRPSINIGIRAGLTLANKKHLVYLEWSQDEAGTMSKTTSLQTPNYYGAPNLIPTYPVYTNGTRYFQSGFAYDRLSLGYGIRLTKEKTLTKIYFITDFSIIFGGKNRATWYYEMDSTANTSTYYYNDAKEVSTEITAYHWGRTSALLGIGIKTDIGAKFKGKEHYLFSLEVNYRQGFQPIGGSISTTHIEDNGKIIAFANELITKGSGIYFQISRKFQLYPWIPLSKKKREGKIL